MAALVGAVLAACGSDPGAGPVASVPPGWADAVRDFRNRVDAHFRSEATPLAPGKRSGFHGLDYYPPDPSYRFAVVPDRSRTGQVVSLLDTQGELRRYRLHSRLHLRKDGRSFTLTVYESVRDKSLFLAFRDATSGTETYGAGRYVDLIAGEGDSVIVDFNYAKNPYCAYDHRWACPLVPEENVIPVPIRAGEKAYKDP